MSDADRAWTQIGDDSVLHDGHIRLVQRRFRLPDGRETVWDVVDIPATVAVLPLTPGGDVVMVRQYRPGVGRFVLSVPGGLVDPGESPVEAAARELREETGYAADSVEVVASLRPINATQDRVAAVARGCVPVGAQSLDEFEDVDVIVMSVADVRRELRAGRLSACEQTYLALDHAGLL